MAAEIGIYESIIIREGLFSDHDVLYSTIQNRWYFQTFSKLGKWHKVFKFVCFAV